MGVSHPVGCYFFIISLAFSHASSQKKGSSIAPKMHRMVWSSILYSSFVENSWNVTSHFATSSVVNVFVFIFLSPMI